MTKLSGWLRHAPPDVRALESLATRENGNNNGNMLVNNSIDPQR